jgi:hypothetical protein
MGACVKYSCCRGWDGGGGEEYSNRVQQPSRAADQENIVFRGPEGQET